MCAVLSVSRSGYYKWLLSKPSNRTVQNQDITRQIHQVFSKSKRTYGSPRITKVLHDMGVQVSRVRVARLMQKAGIRSKVRKKYVITTDSRHAYKVSPHLLERNFAVGQTGKAWVSDITYIKTMEGWLYLTTILDLGSRKVIGWALSHGMKAGETSIRAWQMAIKNQPPKQELIFHSDQGVQYACKEFRDAIGKYPLVKQSMSRKANCWDNAVAESFFKTLKTECVNEYKFICRKQAAMVIFEYIEAWYNTQRLHSALGYLSPTEFERIMLKQQLAA